MLKCIVQKKIFYAFLSKSQSYKMLEKSSIASVAKDCNCSISKKLEFIKIII